MEKTGKTALLSFASLLLATAPCLAQGFDPKLDAPPFANQPNYLNAGGTCFGMSVTAISNWRARQRGQRRLTGVEAEAQAVGVHIAYEDRLATNLVFKAQYMGARASGTNAAATAARLRQLIASDGPQVIIVEGQGLNHAVVAFANASGGFSIYDPDHPGETRTLRVSDGTWGGPGWPRLARVFVSPGLDHFLSHAKSLRTSCDSLNGPCAAGAFWTVDARIERRGSDAVVTGRTVAPVGRPKLRPEFVVASIEGRPVGRVTIPREGSFELTLPPGTTGRVRILAMVGMRGINLAGFSTETLAVPPTPTRGVLGALGSR